MIRRVRGRKTGGIERSPLQPLVERWILRAMVPLKGYKKFFLHNHFENEVLAEALDLAEFIDADDHPALSTIREALRLRYRAVEREAEPAYQGPLARNIARLARLAGLSSVDSRILEFAVILHNDEMLKEATDYLGEIATRDIARVISAITGIPAAGVEISLHTGGALAKSGLLTISRGRAHELHHKMEVLSYEFADVIISRDTDPVSLIRDIVKTSQPPLLRLCDYSHASVDLNTVVPYLRLSVKEKRKGVNLFVYGSPGTGKTQLVRVVAKTLKCTLFEVASEDSEGDPMEGHERIKAYRAAQSIVHSQRALIVFDEAEDIFSSDGSRFGASVAQSSKAWMNNMLEENPVPTIWLSNSVHSLDDAFIRRFDIVMELPIPPVRQRKKVLRKICGEIVDPVMMERMAESEAMTPAVAARAVSVVRSIEANGHRNEPLDMGRTFERLVNNTLEAQGHRKIKINDPARLPDFYDPTLLNADTDLVELAKGLAESKAGRLCLYGPPGTGKSAFGRWIARELGLPLHLKRASDLLGMYVGQTEQQMARAFAMAASDGAILMIDEVDSFLQDRGGLQRSWEVTQVNEMLTQIEAFAGICIVSTNLMGGLDKAALRRFDLKLKFDYLRPAQSAGLLGLYCRHLSLTVSKAASERVAMLGKLTPGDFAAVARQHRFRPLLSGDNLVAALGAECLAKEPATSPIGFRH